MMRTSVTLAYLLNGVPVRPSQEICVLDTHPGFLQAVSLTDLMSIVTSTYQLLNGNYAKAGAAILPMLKTVFKGKNTIGTAIHHLTYQQHGSFVVNGHRVHPDEIRVVYRATSEDDLTQSFGRVDQSADTRARQIRDDGGKQEKHRYTHRFSIPLKTIAPGDYVLTFGSGDDGWFYDVGANTVLTLTITPPPAQPLATPAEALTGGVVSR
jgi:hypothetical protein